jgi:6,7-dimethyl-8-ribityllumazine synthase
MKIVEGNYIGTGLKICIVASRFNELITNKLVGGALDALKRHGVADDDITLAWVPGALRFLWQRTRRPQAENMTALFV